MAKLVVSIKCLYIYYNDINAIIFLVINQKDKIQPVSYVDSIETCTRELNNATCICIDCQLKGNIA